jgi:hypothetical protein
MEAFEVLGMSFGVMGMSLGTVGFAFGLIAFVQTKKLTKTLKEKGILEEN